MEYLEEAMIVIRANTTQSENDLWIRAATARAGIAFQNNGSSFKPADCAEFADEILKEYRRRLQNP